MDGSFPWCSEFVSVLSFCQGLQKLFDGICSCCCCSWEISTGISLCIDIVFGCCLQYYIILLSGSLVVVHHSLNYPYHKRCCWHSQLLYSFHFRMVEFKPNSFSIRFCCTHYPPLDLWKVHFEDKLIVLLV